MKKEISEIPQQQLRKGVTTLIEELAFIHNRKGRFHDFQIGLESLLSKYAAIENDLVPQLIEELKNSTLQQNAAPYLDYTIERLGILNKKDNQERADKTQHTNKANSTTAHLDKSKRPSFVEIGRKIADEERFVNLLKQYRLLRECVEFFENLEKYKDRLKAYLKRVWVVSRKLLLLEQLDKLFSWLFENHRERQFIIDLFTILSFVMRFLWYCILLLGLILNPINILRKLLPREIDDALPID